MKLTFSLRMCMLTALVASSMAQSMAGVEKRLKDAAKTNPCPKMEEKCVSATTCEYTSWIRKSAGRKPVMSGANGMRKNAMKHTKDMANRGDLFHQNLGQVSPGRGNCQVDISGENVAYNFGESNPMAECALQWLKSSGHFQNMINSDFEQCAVAVFKDGNRYYCTQTFARAAPKKECGAGGMNGMPAPHENSEPATRETPQQREMNPSTEPRERRMMNTPEPRERRMRTAPEPRQRRMMSTPEPREARMKVEKLKDIEAEGTDKESKLVEKPANKEENADIKEMEVLKEVMDQRDPEKKIAPDDIKSKRFARMRRMGMRHIRWGLAFKTVDFVKVNGEKVRIVQMCSRGKCRYCMIGSKSRRCLGRNASRWANRLFKHVFWF